MLYSIAFACVKDESHVSNDDKMSDQGESWYAYNLIQFIIECDYTQTV